MKNKRLVCVMLAAVMVCASGLCGCGSGGENRNASAYGSAVEFEGESHDARVMFVNVGKADCAIVDIDGSAWLIDTGTEESFVNTYSALAALGIDSLAGIILTHEHDDHVGGLANILLKYPVDEVCYPQFLMSSVEIESVLNDAGIKAVTVKAGDGIKAAEGVDFAVLAPEKQLADDDNDNSLVIKFTVNGRSFLFTGDMQNAEEQALIASGADLKCDVLKVGNHGNKDSNSKVFADAASPLIAVISTDTKVDPNSASGVVKSRLSMADILTTQSSELGILLTVSRKGEIAVSYPERAAASDKAKVSVTAASKSDQIFTVRNDGDEKVDLSGWFVYSTKGYEAFIYPEGTVLAPGASFTVACRKSGLADTADIVWQQKKIWADSKEDIAVLCDVNGNEISRLKSE